MAFRVYKGKPSVLYFERDGADTHDLEVGSAVSLDTAGGIRHISNDSNDQIIGVSAKAGDAGDTIADVPVLVAEEHVEWEVETDSDGGAADSDVGSYVSIDTGDTTDMNATVDMDDNTVPAFLVTQIVSATKVRGRFARTALRTPAGDDLDS